MLMRRRSISRPPQYRYLDRFTGLQEALSSEQKSRDELLRLQTEIEQTEQQVAQIPVYEIASGASSARRMVRPLTMRARV
jgi:hypothetical protein